MTCPKCSKTVAQNSSSCPYCNALILDDGAKAVLTIGGLLVAGWLGKKIIKKGFSFLKGIDWSSVGEGVRRAIELAQMDMATITDNRERLARAEKLLLLDDKISIDAAAMLVCATLEAGLKSLTERHSISFVEGTSDGMIELATALKEHNKISPEDFQGVKQCVFKVRNPVMHGDFNRFQKSDVQQQLDFVRSFFMRHSLTHGYAY